MKKTIISIALLTSALCAFGQTPIEKFSRVRVDMRDHQPVDLARLGIEVDHGVWEKGVSFTHELTEKDFILKQNYPNPTTNTTVIDVEGLPKNTQSAQLIVTDVAGKTIYSEGLQSVGNQKIMLNTEGWVQGIYFYQIEINGQRTAARQFVKL